MEVTVKLFADLREGRFNEEKTQLPDQSKVKDVVQRFNISSEDVRVCLVNGRNADANSSIQNGDTISLFPPVGGG